MSFTATVSKSIPPVLFTRADKARFLREVIDEFEDLGQSTDHLVRSPTDAVRVGEQVVELPRYVFLGTQAGSSALKLAIYAGWQASDVGPSFALLETARHLLRRPEEGLGYVLSLYPLVHASGIDADSPSVDLSALRWNAAAGTEVERLASDFSAWQLDGWINIRRHAGADFIVATAVGLPVDPAYFPVEQGRYHIIWRAASESRPGPLDLGAQLQHRAFGLELEIPAHWPDGLFAGAVSTTIRAFLTRYRAARAYALHL